MCTIIMLLHFVLFCVRICTVMDRPLQVAPLPSTEVALAPSVADATHPDSVTNRGLGANYLVAVSSASVAYGELLQGAFDATDGMPATQVALRAGMIAAGTAIATVHFSSLVHHTPRYGVEAEPHPQAEPNHTRRWRRLAAVVTAATLSLGLAATDDAAVQPAPAQSQITETVSPATAINHALTKDVCNIKVSGTEVMTVYNELYGTDPSTLSDIELATSVDSAIKEWQMSRSKLTFAPWTEDTHELLQLAHGADLARYPIDRLYAELDRLAAIWGLPVIRNWDAKTGTAGDIRINSGTSPAAMATPTESQRRVIIGIIRDLATLPIQLNQGGLVHALVIGDVIDPTSGGYVVGDGNVYVDYQVAPSNVFSHEIGHDVMDNQICANTPRSGHTQPDAAWQDLQPTAVPYAFARRDVEEGLVPHLSRYLLARGASALSDAGNWGQRAADQEPKNAANYVLTVVEPYGIQTPGEDKATLFEVMSSPLEAWQLFQAIDLSAPVNAKLSLALARMRVAYGNPALADYMTSYIKTQALSTEVERRLGTEVDTVTRDLLITSYTYIWDMIVRGMIDPKNQPLANVIRDYQRWHLFKTTHNVTVRGAGAAERGAAVG